MNRAMAKKKTLKKFRAVTAVKALARERIGTPPGTKVLPKKRKADEEKHKPTLNKMLSEE